MRNESGSRVARGARQLSLCGHILADDIEVFAHQCRLGVHRRKCGGEGRDDDGGEGEATEHGERGDDRLQGGRRLDVTRYLYDQRDMYDVKYATTMKQKRQSNQRLRIGASQDQRTIMTL